eukprot:g8327.t1
MNSIEEDKPLSLFLGNLPSKGTLTELVTGCIIPADEDQVSGDGDNNVEDDCFKIDCCEDAPLILQLNKPRYKKKKTGLERSREIRKSNQLKRGLTQSPVTKLKKAKLTIDVTLLTICGSGVITADPFRTERNLSRKLKAELIEIASRLGLDSTGRKCDLITQLMKQYHIDRRTELNGARRSSSLYE